MADDPRPPVAIRITRPYASEEEYLGHELDLLSRTGITLVGAQHRPQGVILRFELVLTAGTVLVRGEGRVVGYKPNAYHGVAGLTLRFTRIDARSKALLDKAAAMREQRRPSGRPPIGSEAPTDGAASGLTVQAVRLEARHDGAAEISRAVRAPPTAGDSMRPAGPISAVAPPPDRDALLDRLRARGRSLDEATVRQILEQRPRRA